MVKLWIGMINHNQQSSNHHISTNITIYCSILVDISTTTMVVILPRYINYTIVDYITIPLINYTIISTIWDCLKIGYIPNEIAI